MRSLARSLLPLLLAALYIGDRLGTASAQGHGHGPQGHHGQGQGQGAPAPRGLSLSALLSPQSQFPLPRPSATFRCENAGFLYEDLPSSFVLDGVCDCCDGSDERVAKGQHPFYPEPEAAPAAPAPVAVKEPESTGGWLGSFFAASDDSAAAASTARVPAAEEGFSPCANTCAPRAASFLAALEARIASYAAGLDAKNARLRTELPVSMKKLSRAAMAAQGRVEAARNEYRAARTASNGGMTERVRRAEYYGNRAQQELEHYAWLLGKQVPLRSPDDDEEEDEDAPPRMRPPPPVGPYKEWLLLWDTCVEYAWPQRRFGHFGEQRDWYLMRLCPLANATQTAMREPPLREGADYWRNDEEGATNIAELVPPPPSANAAEQSPPSAPKEKQQKQQQHTRQQDAQSEQSDEGQQSWVLGFWQGVLAQESSDPAATAAEIGDKDEAEDSGAKGKGKGKGKGKKKQKKAPASAAAAGSFSSGPAGSVAPPASLEPRFSVPLRHGEPCWQVGPRQANVVARCGRADRIVSVSEDGKCKYRFELETPAACEAGHLARLRQQLKEHKAWFARRPPRATPAPTREQMMLKLHDEL